MSKKLKSFNSIFKQSGLLFPTTPEEVEVFRNNNDMDLSQNPKDWDSPLNIIKRGPISVSKISLATNVFMKQDLEGLAMVAREGKEVTSEIRQKMLDDRKNAKKK